MLVRLKGSLLAMLAREGGVCAWLRCRPAERAAFDPASAARRAWPCRDEGRPGRSTRRLRLGSNKGRGWTEREETSDPERPAEGGATIST
jgi:hypothetical protein